MKNKHLKKLISNKCLDICEILYIYQDIYILIILCCSLSGLIQYSVIEWNKSTLYPRVFTRRFNFSYGGNHNVFILRIRDTMPQVAGRQHLHLDFAGLDQKIDFAGQYQFVFFDVSRF